MFYKLIFLWNTNYVAQIQGFNYINCVGRMCESKIIEATATYLQLSNVFYFVLIIINKQNSYLEK